MPQGGSAVKLITSPKGLRRETQGKLAAYRTFILSLRKSVSHKKHGEEKCNRFVENWFSYLWNDLSPNRDTSKFIVAQKPVCFDWKPGDRGELDKRIFGFGGAEGLKNQLEIYWWCGARVTEQLYLADIRRFVPRVHKWKMKKEREIIWEVIEATYLESSTFCGLRPIMYTGLCAYFCVFLTLLLPGSQGWVQIRICKKRILLYLKSREH